MSRSKLHSFKAILERVKTLNSDEIDMVRNALNDQVKAMGKNNYKTNHFFITPSAFKSLGGAESNDGCALLQFSYEEINENAPLKNVLVDVLAAHGYAKYKPENVSRLHFLKKSTSSFLATFMYNANAYGVKREKNKYTMWLIEEFKH
jgi:hypothetical protein